MFSAGFALFAAGLLRLLTSHAAEAHQEPPTPTRKLNASHRPAPGGGHFRPRPRRMVRETPLPTGKPAGHTPGACVPAAGVQTGAGIVWPLPASGSRLPRKSRGVASSRESYLKTPAVTTPRVLAGRSAGSRGKLSPGSLRTVATRAALVAAPWRRRRSGFL